MPITIPTDNIVSRQGDRYEIRGAASLADLEVITDAFVHSTPVDLRLEGDHMPYDGTVLALGGAKNPAQLVSRISLSPALGRLTLAEKQTEFRVRFNQYVARYGAYLGAQLPSVSNVPGGQEAGQYDENGDWAVP